MPQPPVASLPLICSPPDVTSTSGGLFVARVPPPGPAGYDRILYLGRRGRFSTGCTVRFRRSLLASRCRGVRSPGLPERSVRSRLTGAHCHLRCRNRPGGDGHRHDPHLSAGTVPPLGAHRPALSVTQIHPHGYWAEPSRAGGDLAQAGHPQRLAGASRGRIGPGAFRHCGGVSRVRWFRGAGGPVEAHRLRPHVPDAVRVLVGKDGPRCACGDTGDPSRAPAVLRPQDEVSQSDALVPRRQRGPVGRSRRGLAVA